jgi:hypothetical protein
MDKQAFTRTATDSLARFGEAAHTAIGLYREGGERLAGIAGERWDAAFEQAKPQLSRETRKNAANARKVFGRYYARGLAMSADGAVVAIDTVVGAAIAGVERVGAYKPA